MRNFFRLMRVGAEHRGPSSAALVPALLGVCTADGVCKVVGTAAFADELAPSYCGAVAQLLTVHWRRFVHAAPPPPPPPVDGHVVPSQVQAFASPDMGAKFAALMSVALAGLSGHGSPALVRMHLRFLNLLHKRIHLYRFKPFVAAMAPKFQAALLAAVADQGRALVREEVLDTLFSMAAADVPGFAAGPFKAYLATLPVPLPHDAQQAMAAAVARATDAPTFSRTLLGCFNDVAVAHKFAQAAAAR